MVAVRTFILTVWLLLIPALLSAGSPGMSAEAHDAFSRHWWERLAPARSTPAEQLEYADELKETGRLRQASRAYRALVYNWPKSAEAPAAQFNHAACLEQRGRYTEAFKAYQFLVDIYAGFFSYEDVVSRQLAIAKKEAERKRRFLFFTYTTPRDAIPLFKKLIRNCPRCEGVPELQYRIGEIHEEAGHYELAIEAYQKYLHMYPTGAKADQASFRRADCYYRLARRSPNDREARAHALAAFEYFLARHPKSGMREQAMIYVQEMRMTQASAYYQEALSYEKSARRTRDANQIKTLLTAAHTVYERLKNEYPDSRWAYMAGTRIGLIKQKLEKYDEK